MGVEVKDYLEDGDDWEDYQFCPECDGFVDIECWHCDACEACHDHPSECEFEQTTNA
jgi:hypothetical protein